MKLYTQWRNSAGQRIRIALALEVDDTIIAQSTAIFEYLEEQHPQPPLLPADPVARAQARAIAHHVAADMHPVTVNRVRRYLAEALLADEPALDAFVAHWSTVGFTAL